MVAFLLFLKMKGDPLGKYWVVYPLVRLLDDAGWMAYFGNPYLSWYIRNFGVFFLSVSFAFGLDGWGTAEIQK